MNSQYCKSDHIKVTGKENTAFYKPEVFSTPCVDRLVPVFYVMDDVMLLLGSSEYNHAQKNGCGVIQEHRQGSVLYVIISICCSGDVINHQLPYKHFFTITCKYNVVKNTCSLI